MGEAIMRAGGQGAKNGRKVLILKADNLQKVRKIGALKQETKGLRLDISDARQRMTKVLGYSSHTYCASSAETRNCVKEESLGVQRTSTCVAWREHVWWRSAMRRVPGARVLWT